MTPYVYVFIGGGIGSICRFLIAQWMPIKAGQIPWATFLANLLSCILIGILVGIMESKLLDEEAKWLLIVGFCGGFSTFSTFSIEIFQLIQNGYFWTAFAYILVSILLCLAGIWLGIKAVNAF